jgi:hypothetical protein
MAPGPACRLFEAYGRLLSRMASNKPEDFDRQAPDVRVQQRPGQKMLDSLFLHEPPFRKQQREAKNPTQRVQ